MNLSEIKNILKCHGQDCLDLSDRLKSEGNTISKRDKDLIRVAMYPIIQEQCGFLQQAFLMESKETFNMAKHSIKEAFDFLVSDF